MALERCRYTVWIQRNSKGSSSTITHTIDRNDNSNSFDGNERSVKITKYEVYCGKKTAVSARQNVFYLLSHVLVDVSRGLW